MPTPFVGDTDQAVAASYVANLNKYPEALLKLTGRDRSQGQRGLSREVLVSIWASLKSTLGSFSDGEYVTLGDRPNIKLV
jgi:hypothetical protein